MDREFLCINDFAQDILCLDGDGKLVVQGLNGQDGADGDTSVVTPIASGNIIATHDDGNGNAVNIQETCTPITRVDNCSVTYTDECGVQTDLLVHEFGQVTQEDRTAVISIPYTIDTTLVGVSQLSGTHEETYTNNTDCAQLVEMEGEVWNIGGVQGSPGLGTTLINSDNTVSLLAYVGGPLVTGTAASITHTAIAPDGLALKNRQDLDTSVILQPGDTVTFEFYAEIGTSQANAIRPNWTAIIIPRQITIWNLAY